MTLKLFETPSLIQKETEKYLRKNGFIDRMMTVEDFLKRALLFEEKSFIDEDIRVLLLREAADFEDFEKLKFKRDFISFLESSPFILSFLEECSRELVNLDDLENADIFAEYVERIEVIKRLRFRYEDILQKRGYIDPIFSPFYYRLNISFIKSFREITLFQNGYINAFWMKIFLEISEIVPFYVSVSINDFNKIVKNRYEGIGFELEEGFSYLLDLSEKKILKKEKILKNSPRYEILALSNPLLEIAFAKKKIFDFYKKGISFEDMVVIVNSQEYLKYIDMFDKEGLFYIQNFSFFKDSSIYKKLKAVYDFASEKSYEHFYRLERLGVSKEKSQKIVSVWDEKLSKDKIFSIFDSFKEYDLRESFIYEEELFNFMKLYPHFKDNSFNKIFHLFLNRLQNRELENEKEGVVKVSDIFKEAGMRYKGVVVLGFNEGKGIRTPFNDLFLSSALRKEVGMPTVKDMKNMQKSLYSSIFENADEVAVSYVKDEQNRPCKFLYELSLRENLVLDEEKLGNILFNSSFKRGNFKEREIVLEYDFEKELLSPFKLKMFLDCKRKYYLWYIEGIEEFIPPTDEIDERVIGKYLHEALEDLYKNGIFYDEKELLRNLRAILIERIENNDILKLSSEIWLKKLDSFAKKEVERFKIGFKPIMFEKKFEKEYKGFKFQGIIDRIDVKEDKFYIIDYKSGSVPSVSKRSLEKESNFQLQIYYRILEDMMDIGGLYYCDLNSGEWIEENLFDEKLALFDEKLEFLREKEINFEKTEDFSKCRYCPYTIICQRE